MSGLRDKDLAQRLRSIEAPEPPQDLLRQIQAEIPEEMFPENQGGDDDPKRFGRSSWNHGPLRLLAATLLMVIGGGFLAYRVSLEAPSLMSPAHEAAMEPALQEQPADDSRFAEDGASRGEGSSALSKAGSETAFLADSESRSVVMDKDESAEFSQGRAVPELSPGEAKAADGVLAQPQMEQDLGASRSRLRARERQREPVARGDLQRSPTEEEPTSTEVVPQDANSRVQSLSSLREQKKVLAEGQAPPAPASSSAAGKRIAKQELGLEQAQRAGRAEVPKPSSKEHLRKQAGADDREEESSELLMDEVTVTAESPVVNVTSAVVGQEISIGRSRREKKTKEIPAPILPLPSGSLVPPNDQPYADNFFRSYDTNPFIDTEDDHLSTFGLDVDTGSYTVARRYLQDGHLPPREAVRLEEMVNYFDYGDAPPSQGDFAISTEGSQSPFTEGPRYRLLRVNVQGRVVQKEGRSPAVLTFVVDTSGSMAQENRLGLVKSSLGLLLDQLTPEDRVGLVEFGSRGKVILEPTRDLKRLRAAIDELHPGSATNAEEGLVLGYEMAAKYLRRGGTNRVILCSDGVANVGNSGPDAILETIREQADKGIELTTLGFGMGNLNDELMERLADQGNGRYAYLDSIDEAYRVLVEDLTGTLETIAAEARVQVEFDAKTVERYRLLGYENRDIADEDFRNDRVDAGEIGAGHSVTALYEVKLAKKTKANAPLATLHLRYASRATAKIEEVSHRVLARDVERKWAEASPRFRLSALVAEFAEILRGSYWARDSDLRQVFQRAQRLSPSFEGDTKVAEFVDLVGKASRITLREGGTEP